MFILKKGHQPGVYVPLRALFLVLHVTAPIIILRLSFQLVRVMGEKTNGTSKGVSISSYFQKVSSGGAKSGSSSTSTSPTPTTGAVKSGGKRNILKKM